MLFSQGKKLKFKKIFSFSGTRKPDFKNIQYLDYDKYWQHLGVKIRDKGKLRDREMIFIKWIDKNSLVLDIACGDSPLLLTLKKEKNCRVEGFDISSLIIKEQNKVGVSALVVDISSDDFELDKNYDFIILSEVLEHLVFPEKLLAKLKGHAKYLIISFPNSAFYRYRISFLLKGRFFAQWVYHPAEHLRFWSHIDFLDWLDALGLKVVASKASNGLTIGPFKLFNLWKNLFGFQMCYLVSQVKK